MKIPRRNFITLLGSTAVAWPLAAHAQQSAMPVIGFLHGSLPKVEALYVVGFRQSLKEAGYIEGRNVAIEFRWAENHYDRLPALAAELVGRRVAVIVTGTPAAALAAKAATTTIPIVFAIGPDPVKLGLVASLNRPGGNVTGVSFLANALEAKRLGLLHDLVPQATVIGVLLNPDNASAETQLRELEEAARALGLPLHVANASSERDFDSAFASFVQHGAGALVVGTDAFFASRRELLVALAARNAVPAIYFSREVAETGGLMSYGASITDAFRQVGVYAGKILKGAVPADLPVMQSVKFEFVINLKTAKALGLTVPPGILAIADQVIE
jgi:putative tryptophan/tyrosine transport system substrate-binding protein